MADLRYSRRWLFAILALSLLSSCAQRVSVRKLSFTPEFGGTGTSATESVIRKGRIAQGELVRGNASEDVLARYRLASTAVVELAARSLPIEDGEGDGNSSMLPPESGVAIGVRLSAASDVPWNLSEIRSIEASETLKIRGFREQVTRDGIGVPLVLEMNGEPEGPAGSFVPGTAVVDFSSPVTTRVTIYDPLRTESVRLDGIRRPLRADFTAPVGMIYAMRDRQRINLAAMLKPDKFRDSLGLQQIDPIDPGRTPVVFIHGLKSNPDTWRDTINELRADPRIRERFEFWVFGYTTGPPIPYSAMELRESLREMAERRDSLGARTGDVVLVGHSMGGLISRLVTQSSGDENWFKLFEKPIDELELPDDDRELLRRMAYFEPLPFVSRIVFVSTPHRGSKFAENPIGLLGSALIQIPGALLSLSTDLLSGSLTALTPLGQEIARDVPTSIDMLRSDVIGFFRAMPPNPEVIHHSIIGTGDNLVPYESAHIEEAVSEKLVPAEHDTHQHPEAIAELRRILREHAGIRD